MWMAAQHVLGKGAFNKMDQSCFERLYGTDSLNKFKNLVGNESKKEVLKFVENKILRYSDELRSLVPNSYDERFGVVKKELSQAFK